MERGIFIRRGLRNEHGDVSTLTGGQISPVGVEQGSNGQILSSTNEGKSSQESRRIRYHLRQAPKSPK